MRRMQEDGQAHVEEPARYGSAARPLPSVRPRFPPPPVVATAPTPPPALRRGAARMCSIQRPIRTHPARRVSSARFLRAQSRRRQCRKRRSAHPAGRQPGAPLDLSTLGGRPGAAPPPAAELPPPPPRNPNATGAVPATLPPGATPKDEYDLGYGYILRKDYALAEDTFRPFLRKYPSDRLAPEAQYWLGESMFQRQRYRDAAEAFLNVSTKYETTAKAPDALLRLGQSLAALGEKEAACASLGEVMRKYPRASLSVKQGVDREQKRVHC